MGRVALVTGGTRGIGQAISLALKAEGYTVAANYAGNDEAAAKFKEETGKELVKDVDGLLLMTDNFMRKDVQRFKEHAAQELFPRRQGEEGLRRRKWGEQAQSNVCRAELAREERW